MNIGIIGLGLIGGSMAKAIKQNTEHVVFGTDIKDNIVRKAVMLEAIDEPLTDDRLALCDIIILALYPADTIGVLKDKCNLINKNSIVLDCTGVKGIICGKAETIAEEQGFVFVGGHPMAGVEFSGFEHSQKTLFKNASMILTPPKTIDIQSIETLKKFFLSIGFGNVELTTAEKHDKLIAYTSQLAHVVSSAYIKSPAAADHKGFSAGSYKDMTRVAKLNPSMWTELFLANKENLVSEIDGLILRLGEYREAICGEREEELLKLLKEGTERKLLLDQRKE